MSIAAVSNPSPSIGGRGVKLFEPLPCDISGAGPTQSPSKFTLATPKSSTFTVYPPRPLGSNQMLSGFRSRCTIPRSEEHTSELQSRQYLVCRLLLEKKKTMTGGTRLVSATTYQSTTLRLAD